MIISKATSFLTVLWAASCSTVFGQTVPQDRARAELDRAIRARLEGSYPDFCRRFGSGRIFDVLDEEIRIDGDTATVSYLLVVFDNCEEGAPYSGFRETETWIRRADDSSYSEFAIVKPKMTQVDSELKQTIRRVF